MTEELLLEASSGKAIHLFDNGDLTFSKLKEIFAAASEGELEGTEKTSGKPLLISFSIKDGRLKCALTKAEIRAGGLSPEEFAKKLEPELKETFLNAAHGLERTLQSLSHDEQGQLFGEETNTFFNCSILNAGEEGTISYDTKAIIINNDGHITLDRASNAFSSEGTSEKLSALQAIIGDSQEQQKHDNYSVQVNAIKKLKALSDNKPYNIAISKINSLLSTVNSLIKNDSLSLTENSSISEFMITRVYILINAVLQKGKIKNFDPVVKMNIAKRILGVKGISVKDISSNISKEQLDFIKDNLLNDTSRSEILKTAILPLETIVNDFAVELLKGLQSAFILDNDKEINRLKQTLKKAIDFLQSSKNEELMKNLKQQMSRLQSVEKVSSAVEGFVFDYDGKTYKFSGNFAPISNILSLFKAQSEQQNIQENYIYDIINEEIRKKGNKYCLVSKKKHKNLGCYDSRTGAEKREKQVQYFKHVKKENMAGGAVQGVAVKPLDIEKEK